MDTALSLSSLPVEAEFVVATATSRTNRASLPIHQFLFSLVIGVDYPITAGFNDLLGSSCVVNVGKWVTLLESANLESQKHLRQLQTPLTKLQL